MGWAFMLVQGNQPLEVGLRFVGEGIDLTGDILPIIDGPGSSLTFGIGQLLIHLAA